MVLHHDMIEVGSGSGESANGPKTSVMRSGERRA